MEAKTDRRIKRTRYLLVHALTSLMLKKRDEQNELI